MKSEEWAAQTWPGAQTTRNSYENRIAGGICILFKIALAVSYSPGIEASISPIHILFLLKLAPKLRVSRMISWQASLFVFFCGFCYGCAKGQKRMAEIGEGESRLATAYPGHLLPRIVTKSWHVTPADHHRRSLVRPLVFSRHIYGQFYFQATWRLPITVSPRVALGPLYCSIPFLRYKREVLSRGQGC